MKVSQDTLKKYAEAASQKGFLEQAKDTLLNLGKGLGVGVAIQNTPTAIRGIINDRIPQDSRIGDMLVDFANKSNAVGMPAVLEDSALRSFGDLWRETKRPTYLLSELVTAYPAYSDTYPRVSLSKHMWRAGDTADDYIRALAEEAASMAHPKAVERGLAVSIEDLAAQMASQHDFSKGLGMVTAPKNNTYAITHELGHLADDVAVSGLQEKANSLLPGLGDLAYRGYSMATGPLREHLQKIPAFDKFQTSLRARSPVLGNLLNTVTSASVPGIATAALAGSQTIRDILRTVIPLDVTDKAMDFVEEHPVITSMSGSIPQIMSELYTNIPGTKLTHDFYSHLNSLGPAAAGELGSLAAKAGKFSPILEAAKFLGHNLLSHMTYLTVPVTAAALAYLNSPNKEAENA